MTLEPDDGWAAEDWKAFYDERAGIREYDGCQDRGMAEAMAFRETIEAYMGKTGAARSRAAFDLRNMGISP
jgi:hypothetical protein